MLQVEDKLSYSGKTLKEIREDRGLSLEEMAESTRIAKRHLINIEEENFSDLPSIIYLRDFLGSYVRLLDLDEVEVLRQMSERFDQWEKRTI